MLLTLLLAAAAPQSAVEAERAFAADAQRIGQWTAFRKWADPDAIMFTPQIVRAQDYLKALRDPAKAVTWQPIASYLSCDGSAAANTGAWQRADGSVGYFTTIWSRNADGSWRWTMDHGDALATPRTVPAEPMIRRASCAKPVPVSPPFAVPPGAATGFAAAPDDTLRIRMHVTPQGERVIGVTLWNGSTFEPVITDRVAAPPPTSTIKP